MINNELLAVYEITVGEMLQTLASAKMHISQLTEKCVFALSG